MCSVIGKSHERSGVTAGKRVQIQVTLKLWCRAQKRRVHVVCDEDEQHDQNNQNRSEHSREDSHEEQPVVSASDAVVQPFAVVVKVCDAFVAGAAVFGFRSHIHLTEGTVQIINDMFMFGVVKHRHGAGVILPAADADIRWINRDGRHVSQQMENKSSADKAICRKAPWWREKRNINPKSDDGHEAVDEPGDELEHVERQRPTIHSGAQRNPEQITSTASILRNRSSAVTFKTTQIGH